MHIFLSWAKRLWEQRFARFFVVGCFNTLLDISLLLVFYEGFGLHKVLANSISVPAAITVSYLLNHRIVFRQKHGYSLNAYLKFMAITGFSALVIQDLIIYVITTYLLPSSDNMLTIMGWQIAMSTVDLVIAKMAGVSLGLIWNFLLYKYVVFRKVVVDEADEIVVA